jgi:hypothetical protein
MEHAVRGGFRLLVGVGLLLVVLAGTVLAQESGVRRLEEYREVSPSEEIPSLFAGFYQVQPESEIDLGIGHLHGFLGERVLHDDNIYLAKYGKESDTLFLTTPGLLEESFFGEHRLRLSYTPTLRTYSGNHDLDAWDQDATADLRLDFVDAYVRIRDAFNKTEELRDIRFAGQTGRTENQFTVECGALLGYLGLGARWQNRYRTYGSEVPSFEDLTENEFGLFAWWGHHPDYDWTAEYQLLFRDYRGDVINDAVQHALLFGLDGSPYDGLDFVVKAGPVYVDPRNHGAVPRDTSLVDLMLETELSMEIVPDLKGNAFYVQRPEYSTLSDYQKTYRTGVGLTWDLDPGWVSSRWSVFYERANRVHEPDLGYVGLAAALDVDVTHWMKGGVGYEWQHRSGKGDLDYTVNQVYLQLLVYF